MVLSVLLSLLSVFGTAHGHPGVVQSTLSTVTQSGLKKLFLKVIFKLDFFHSFYLKVTS